MKKRDLLPALHSAIRALTDMASDAAKLEITDNDQASRRLKRAVLSFKRGELSAFSKLVLDVRTEINMIPTRKRVKPDAPVITTVEDPVDENDF